jgi:hypothetical protein
MNEGLDEAVGDNYLYHATQPSGMMRILRSGFIKASHRPQEATKSRTQSPTVSTTRSKSYAESNDFVDFLNLPNEGNAVIIVFDRNAVANHYKMFSTSQGTQTVGDEFEEVIVVPKGQMPIKGTMKGFYFNPKRTAEIEEFKDMPWFNELLNSPYYMGQTQGMAESSEEKETTKGSVTSTFKIDPKSEYDKGKADSYYKRGDRSDKSPDPKEYLRGYDENDDYKDWGRDDPVDEGSSNILKGISRMVKGKPTPGAEYQKYFDAYKKAMQTGDKTAIANATRDLQRIEKVAGPAFFEENARSSVLEGIYRQQLNLKKIEEQFGEIKLEGGVVRNNQPLLRFLSKNNIPSEIFDHLIEQKIGKVTKDKTITESIDKTDKNLNHIFSQFNNFSTGNNVKVGDSVSALSLEALSLSNNTIKLTGFLKPQSIANINDNYVEFESGETFPKQKIIQTKMWRQVIFFHNVEQAKKCLTVMSLNSGKISDWEFTINNSLTESAIHEGLGLPYPGTYEQERGLESTDEQLDEKWSDKYKRSIDCSHPKGFSQRAHCQGKKKK